ncbi:MAG: M28 family metallopeptidase [Bacteroidetes bacterium]|nr:M28 family metallopeptidase [Bacteroidota bacterium]
MFQKIICHISALFCFTAITFCQQAQISGFTASGQAIQLQLENNFDKNLSAENIGATIKELSAFPHHLGSPGDKVVAEKIYNKLKSYGFDVRIDTYHVLFPTPKIRVLEMISPTKFQALLKEPALKEDATSGQQNQLPTYNAYSADGDVTGELVFVNYGLPDDYEKLAAMGVDVKGKIVIAKYGRSWRGTKPKVAQEHGAIGCIIYSDPMDDGYTQGDVYPKGAFKSEYGVQRGSVQDMVIYPGDPLTPGIGATADAKRIAGHQDAPNLLKIPVLPISYHDALPLLEALEGPVAPAGWNGTLPITYHVGPGKTKVHLQLAFNWDIVPCYDVIGMIKGSEFPDEWIIRGNHHDAWVNGANDPISGQAALLEEAKSMGILMKTGWRPKRTIVYCAWDGEEPGLLGSTEWVETHAKELQDKCVLYINSDLNGRGFLSVGGSHALESFMTEIASDVNDPQTNVSVLKRLEAIRVVSASGLKAKKEAMENNSIGLDALGSGSDYSSFLQHLGLPTLDMGYYGENDGGEYHSIYDSYDNYKRFKDPTFVYGVALSETAGRAVLRMANADVLPFDFRNLYKVVNGYTTELVSLVNTMRESTDIENEIIANGDDYLAADTAKHLQLPKPKGIVPYLDFAPLQNALVTMQAATDSLFVKWNNELHSPTDVQAFNRDLYKAEQQLLLANGLPRRSWYKHAIYAPGFYTGYGVKTMPGIREAIEQRKWDEAQDQIVVVANALKKFTDYIQSVIK